jgi:hypothetical protein
LIGSGGTDLSVGAIFALCNFTGADWYEVGRLLAEDVVKQCGAGSGKSGKVSIVQGELTAAASVDQIGGITLMIGLLLWFSATIRVAIGGARLKKNCSPKTLWSVQTFVGLSPSWLPARTGYLLLKMLHETLQSINLRASAAPDLAETQTYFSLGRIQFRLVVSFHSLFFLALGGPRLARGYPCSEYRMNVQKECPSA